MTPTLALLVLGLVAATTAETIPDGPRGGGTTFTKCGGSFFNRKDRCMNIKITKLQVQMGSDGTDDNVKAKICSEDAKSCCQTPFLDKSLSDDWHSNSLELWGPSYLGDCAKKNLKLRRGLEVTLQKEGGDSLGVQSFHIEAETADRP